MVTCLESISHFTVAKEHNYARVMSKQKEYDVSFKLEAVECAEKKSKEAAAREMGMDSKMIHEWRKQMLASLKKKGASSRKRQCGAGRKALHVNLEMSLFS